MLCYKTLSKVQVYIFLHENVFYFLKANYDTKMLLEDVYFAFSFFQ